MKSERASLGWIGMGQIGTPMVLRLIAAGHDVMVWGRNTARLAPALAAGAREAPSAAQVAARSEAVFLCVLDDAAVEDVVFGAAGVAEGARRGTLIVDHSTIHPQSAVAFSSRVAASSLGWIDAPVSGGAGGAADGTLSVYLGGEAENVERVRPWLSAYARNVTHFGAVGTGQTAKACNQAVVCATIAIWAEALTLARDNGIDAALLVEALGGGWADSRIRAVLAPAMAARTPQSSPVRSLAIFLKDLDIIADVARTYRSPAFLSGIVASLFRSAERGGGSRGLNGLMELYSDRS